MSTDTVPAAVMIPPEPRLGGEGDMIREDRWQEIHQLFEVEHVSIAEIARRLDRVPHHATTISIRGNSYRLKEKLKAGLIRPAEATT